MKTETFDRILVITLILVLATALIIIAVTNHSNNKTSTKFCVSNGFDGYQQVRETDNKNEGFCYKKQYYQIEYILFDYGDLK